MATKKKVFKMGDKFKVTTASNSYVVGEVYNVDAISGANVYDSRIGQYISTVYVTNYTHCDKKEIEEEVKSLQDKLTMAKAKLAFLVDNSLEEFDDGQFKVYQALTVLDSTKDKLKRSKLIASLINS